MVLYDDGWPRKRLGGQLACAVSWAVVTVIGLCLRASPHHHGTHTQLGLPPCPSVLFFHRPCPGCGLTTSWTATIHGDLRAGFEAHPIGPVLYGVYAGAAVLSFVGWLRGKRLRSDSKPSNIGLIAILCSLIGVGVVRFATTVYTDPLPPPYNILSSLGPGEQGRQAPGVPKENPPTNLARPD